MQQALTKISQRCDLTRTEMANAMQVIMAGQASPAQIGAFMLGLHMKGETVTEIASAAEVIRKLALPVKVTGQHLVDIVGTGGDGAKTFNISTASAFVMAAAGAKVAKHNNRAISSQSGSADLLEIANINPALNPQQIAQCINELGIGFMFAPSHHSSWHHTVEPRRELGIRTLFNILGPLVNPARVKKHVIGVYSKHWLEPVCQALQKLGSQHVLVVHSQDGLDEISIAAATDVAELHNGAIDTYTITPQQLGLSLSSLDSIRVENAQQSLALIEQAFANQPGAARDIVALNAGAGIYAADLVSNLSAGVEKALAVLASGAAQEKLAALQKFTQQWS